MKICFLSASHPYDDTRVLHKEACALSDAGFDVTHLAPIDSALGARPASVGGVTIRLYPKVGRISGLLRMFREARVLRADCYHCNEVESWVAGLLLKLLRPGTLVVFDIHEHYPSRFEEPHVPKWLRWIGPGTMRLMLKSLPWVTDYVILAKRSILQDLPSRYIRRGFVFNYGVMRMDVPLRSNVSPDVKRYFSPGVFTAIHVGGMSRARGWPQMLQALAMTRNSINVVCLGKVDEGIDLFNEEVARLGLGERVRTLDKVPFDQMFSYLSMADVGLMLYQPGILNHTYAFPMKLYDYMWAGLPSIAPAFSVEVEPVIKSENCGICIDTSSSHDLAGALDWLADNRKEADAMGGRAKQAVVSQYNWESQAQNLVEIYRKLSVR